MIPAGKGGKPLSPARKLKALQARQPFRFKSRLSQHFLIDPNVLDRIAAATGAGEGDCVLEVGAGAGFLTERLLAGGARVMAVEVDPEMVKLLKRNVGFQPRLRIVPEDILKIDLGRLLDEEGVARCRIAGNLPYHITSPALSHLMGLSDRPGAEKGAGDPAWRSRIERMVFTVQREVGLRMAARPGSKEYGSLSVAVAYVGTCEKLSDISPGAFVPPPEVRSVLLRLTPVSPARLQPEVERAFFAIARAAFRQRRKMLINAAAEVAGGKEEAKALLAGVGISGDRRGETLSLEEFMALGKALANR